MTTKTSLCILMLTGACAVPAAQALEAEFKFKGTLAGIADGGRDLGLLGNEETAEGYADISPWLRLQFSPSWAAFLRVHGYAPTDALTPPGNDSNNTGENPDAYFGLKEAWIEYGGLTSYPGEWLRLGRQRVRQDDAQWWDQDIDALRWKFDTTQVQMDMGIARQFETYRTDDVDIPVDQRDRTYEFASIGGEWLPRHRINIRVTHAGDDNRLPDEADPAIAGEKLTRSQLTWAGASIDNHYFDWRRPPGVSYWFAGNILFGDERRVVLDELGTTVTGHDSDHVFGWTTEGDARVRLARSWPLQLGGGYIYSSAGSDSNPGRQYQQTGVQSNYSRFTGTRSLIYRLNEAYRPELGNLIAITGFSSIDAGNYDASVVYNFFARVDGRQPIISNGLLVDTVTNSGRLGQGLDVVLTRYFSIDRDLPLDDTGEATNSALRLRGSAFDPGSAYGPDAEMEYRATLELTLWY